MALVEEHSNVFKDEFVFIDEYLPIDLREEEVTTLQEVESSKQTLLEDDRTKGSKDAKNSNHQDKDQLKTHVCFKCSKMFTTHAKMLKHLRIYHQDNVQISVGLDGKRSWLCQKCHKTFVSRKGSIIHQRTHTGERPYTCRTCRKSFIDSSTLMKHQAIHQAVRPFICRICQRGFNQKVALQRHEKTHGEHQEFECSYCPKTFLVKGSLEAHEKLHTGLKPFRCKCCSGMFHTLTALRQHSRVHTDDSSSTCIHCKRTFNDSKTLMKHMVIHSTSPAFVCPLCYQGFTLRIAARKHLRSHIGRDNVRFCNLCKVGFESKHETIRHLEQHIKVGSNQGEGKGMNRLDNIRTKKNESGVEKSVSNNLVGKGNEQSCSKVGSDFSFEQCEGFSSLEALCNVAVSAAKELPELLNSKTESNPDKSSCLRSDISPKKYSNRLNGIGFFCKSCRRMYSSSIEFRKHKCTLSSTVVKARGKCEGRSGLKQTLSCDKCSKTFSSRNGFLIHQRSHTGERPYPCRWCDKAFGDSATRHKHERIHTGERPFKCVHCPRAFNQRAALRAHQVTHSLSYNRTHVCKLCPSSFSYFANLRRHVVTCHEEQKAVACPVCEKTLHYDTTSLHDHVNSCHVNPGDKLSCPLCDSGEFADASALCNHIVYHAKIIGVPQMINNNSIGQETNETEC